MELIAKIKEKGLSGCVDAIKHRLHKRYNLILLKKYAKLPIDEYSVVLESEGDCCDNAYALFDYIKNNGYLEKYNVYWMVHHPEKHIESDRIHYLSKDINETIYKDSLKVTSTAKYYLYDHPGARVGYKFRKDQKNVYLCHGYAGFKAPKGIGTLNAREEYTTGKIPVQGCIDWHGDSIPKFILGFPRLDYFYNQSETVNKKCKSLVNSEKYKKIILWMPTFRQCDINKDISENYFDNETGLPLFNTIESMNCINEYLSSINAKIVLKIHPLQAKLDVFNKAYSNMQFIRNEDLEREGIQLYQFIPIFDALITDYSSISTDYFLLDKPIIYILDDIEEYKKSRGLYPVNALDYMPGDHVYNIDELKAAIERLLNGEDKYRKERNELLPLFHTYQDGNASKRILDHLGIIK